MSTYLIRLFMGAGSVEAELTMEFEGDAEAAATLFEADTAYDMQLWRGARLVGVFFSRQAYSEAC